MNKKYVVYVTGDDGIPIVWTEWDGESNLELRTAPFKENVVFTIEENIN